MLTLLHTSDWHLGRRLYGKARYDEFAQFLDWQIDVIAANDVDVLLIAGDIFDTTLPSNQAQTLYYDFLNKVNQTNCRHIVIVGGNHDSPSFLDAPKALLKGFNIHVVGSIGDNLDDEILLLKNRQGVPEMLIVAVPYLRDRDVRTVASGERLDDKQNKLTAGIREHYKNITELAIAKQSDIEAQTGKKIPLIATGHLFAVGGVTVEGDGVRELYVGTLAHVTADIFDKNLDYVALGHLHVPQTVGGQAHIRYSGSPIAMGFGESSQQKQVHLVRFDVDNELANQPIFPMLTTISSVSKTSFVDKVKTSKSKSKQKNNSLDLFNTVELTDELDDNFDEIQTTQNSQNLPPLNQPYNLVLLNDTTLIQSLAVPTFQNLMSIKGDWQTIKSTLENLKIAKNNVWVEVIYDSDTVIGDLKAQVDTLVKDSGIEILRTKNLQMRNQTLKAQTLTETLEELDEQQVFERCLISHNIPNEQKDTMRARYAEVLESLKEQSL